MAPKQAVDGSLPLGQLCRHFLIENFWVFQELASILAYCDHPQELYAFFVFFLNSPFVRLCLFKLL